MKRALALAIGLLAISTAVRAQDLKSTVQRIAAAWERGNVGQLGSHAAQSGMDLDFYGERSGRVAGRQATSMLRLIFEERETIAIRIGSAKEVAGDTRRAAWVDLTWVNRRRGTTIPDSTTVFLALELDDDQWRITEIRLMR